MDNQDGPWSVSVAETPYDARSYSLYIKSRLLFTSFSSPTPPAPSDPPSDRRILFIIMRSSCADLFNSADPQSYLDPYCNGDC